MLTVIEGICVHIFIKDVSVIQRDAVRGEHLLKYAYSHALTKNKIK